jgi:hypothetical protein
VLTKEICKNVAEAAGNVGYTIVLRGDSTLRGHFPQAKLTFLLFLWHCVANHNIVVWNLLLAPLRIFFGFLVFFVFFFFNFVMQPHLWACTRGISPIWLQVREKSRKNLRTLLYFGDLLEPILEGFQPKYGNFREKKILESLANWHIFSPKFLCRSHTEFLLVNKW